jgi:hypothetical protein
MPGAEKTGAGDWGKTGIQTPRPRILEVPMSSPKKPTNDGEKLPAIRRINPWSVEMKAIEEVRLSTMYYKQNGLVV